MKKKICCPQDRHLQKEFKQLTLVETNELHCRFCSEKLNWQVKKRLTEHFQRKDHAKFFIKEEDKEANNTIQPSLIQISQIEMKELEIVNSMKGKFVNIFLQNDIPLGKMKAFKEFFDKYQDKKLQNIIIPSES